MMKRKRLRVSSHLILFFIINIQYISALAREAHEVDVGYEWMQVLNEKQLAAILKICEEALEFSNVGETKSGEIVFGNADW